MEELSDRACLEGGEQSFLRLGVLPQGGLSLLYEVDKSSDELGTGELASELGGELLVLLVLGQLAVFGVVREVLLSGQLEVLVEENLDVGVLPGGGLDLTHQGLELRAVGLLVLRLEVLFVFHLVELLSLSFGALFGV